MTSPSSRSSQVYAGLLRLSLGLICLWAFFDKLLGLGYATKPEQAWLAGGSPTSAFLLHGTHGPLASFYQSLAGNPVVDWLFMLGLLGIGLAFTFGIALKLAGYAGALMMLLMWSAALPPANHPFLDEHIVYLVIFLAADDWRAGDFIGFGQSWAKTELVKRFLWLR